MPEEQIGYQCSGYIHVEIQNTRASIETIKYTILKNITYYTIYYIILKPS